MKNRTVPFGYCFKNCQVVIHPDEADVLKQIFCDYLDGNSLLAIANRLNEQQIEYTPGVIGWNKARVMRIIEDTRYLGGEGYPAIIDTDTHAAAQERKTKKNNLKNTDRQADIYKLTVPTVCPHCGSTMGRRHEGRFKYQERWVCKDTECGTSIRIEDHDLLGQITNLLNQVIQNPEVIRDVPALTVEQPIGVRRLENEIGRVLDSGNIDTDTLKQKMMVCISAKYRNLPSERNTANRLRVDFETTSPLAVFSADLTNRTVTAVHLSEGGTVEIVLRNGQIIGKE